MSACIYVHHMLIWCLPRPEEGAGLSGILGATTWRLASELKSSIRAVKCS